MSKKEALKIVLTDVCCSNGKDFCPLCPLYTGDNCGNISCNTAQLFEAVKTLMEFTEKL